MATTTVTALPGWWSSVHRAEQQALQSLRDVDVVSACTHVVDGIALVTVEKHGEAPRVTEARDPRWGGAARDCVADHEAHYGGRLFVFPGQSALRGTLTAEEILHRSVIRELVVPGHPGPVPSDALVDGLEYVRPVFRQGKVVLTLRPHGRGQFQPFERPRQGSVIRPGL